MCVCVWIDRERERERERIVSVISIDLSTENGECLTHATAPDSDRVPTDSHFILQAAHSELTISAVVCRED